MSLKNLLESLDKISESAYFKTTSTGREVTVGGKKATVLGQIPTNQGSAKYYAIRFTDKKYPGDTYDQIHANKIFDQLGESDVSEGAKPDFLDLDGDGNKTEPMKKAAADKKDPPFDPDETPSSDKDQFGNTIKHRARHLARKGMKQASGVKEGDVTKTATGRIHRAKAGGYGRKIDRDDDSGDRFHSSDIDDVDDAPAAPAAKRGRGRPMKGGDSETGQVKKYDTDTLASWLIGNKPKTLPKGVSSTKHKLKDWMERVETSMISESLIIEGAMGEISALIDEIRNGDLDIYDMLSGKFKPTSKAEQVFVTQLQKKYDEIAAERGFHADDDFEKIIDVLTDELESVLSEQNQPAATGSQAQQSSAGQQPPAGQQPQPAQQGQQTPAKVMAGGKIVGTAPTPQAASQATPIMNRMQNDEKALAKLGISQVQESLADTMNKFAAALDLSIASGRTSLNESMDRPRQQIVTESTLQDILHSYPHEHKMCQEGWGMDEAMYEALCDHYHREGKIPRSVWHGSADELRQCVENCYLKDTGAIMGEDISADLGLEPGSFGQMNQKAQDEILNMPSPIKVYDTPPTQTSAPAPSAPTSPSVNEYLDDTANDNLDEALPVIGAIAGSAIAGRAGAGALGQMAGSTIGRAIGSKIQGDTDYENEELSEGPGKQDVPAALRKQRGDDPLSVKDVLGSKDNLSDRRTLDKLSGEKPGRYRSEFDEATTERGIRSGSLKDLMQTLDEYAREAPRKEPTIGADPIRSGGSRSDGSDRLEPRFSGEKIKSSPLSRSDDSMRSSSMRPRYMEEEENQDGEHSAITGDENTTTPRPMKAMYPTGKENSSRSQDVVSDKMDKRMMYESKSTIKKDQKAERAGKKVTKDLEYDMKHRGKDDKKAERAGKKVTKDIEYDEKHKVNEGKFGQMDADLADLSPEEFKKEYGMTKAEARAKHGAAKSDTKKLDEMDNPDYAADSGKKEYKGKVATAKKMKKDAGKALDKAFDKATPKKKVKEAWDTDYETPESEKGKYKGKTIAELKKMKATLMKKEKRTKAEQGQVAELNFAIRAKQKGGGKWGDVKKESRDIQMETWEKRLGSMLMESVTVNTSSGTEPDSRSVNISATGEDADQLMAMLQNAGLHAGATSGGYQQIQYQQDEPMCEETTDAEFMIPEDKEETESDDGNTAKYRDGKEYDGTGSPAVTTKTPGSDPHNKFDDAEDVPIMAMPRGMGVSQNVEDELAEVIEPVTPQDVIGELDAEDSSNDDMAFIKKVMNHGASQYADSAPNDGEQEQPVSGGASTSMGPISGEMGKQNVAEVEADVEEGNEFSGNLAKAKASGAKEFEVDGKKYPVKEDDYQDEDETNEGYEDGNWAAMRSDDKIQDADAEAYRAGAATTDLPRGVSVTEDPAGGRKGDDDLADPTFAGKNRQGRVSEGDGEVCENCGGMYEGRGHQCSESLNEWANSPQGQSEDEQFETDMEFMTKVISGGLNNQKQDQTTLPSTRVRTGAESPPRGADTSIGADLKRLAGIN